MDIFQTIFQWAYDLAKGGTYLFSQLTRNLGGGFTIIGLVSFGGLMAYLVVAAIKWGIK